MNDDFSTNSYTHLFLFNLVSMIIFQLSKRWKAKFCIHTVWCNISGDAAGELWDWSLLGVKELKVGRMHFFNLGVKGITDDSFDKWGRGKWPDQKQRRVAPSSFCRLYSVVRVVSKKKK